MVRLITRDGLKKLNEELEDRKTRLRQEIAQAIKEAKEQGDLSENAEYSEAKSQQNENESRIGELEMVVKNSQVVEKDERVKGAQIGSVVKVKLANNEMQFTIVGSNEADPVNFKISNESPLGKAFMGKDAGDDANVLTPKGDTMIYKILEVK
ncbi:MAG: transcription elongation factor GreA [Candidatus Moraniibacteriota bacterium]